MLVGKRSVHTGSASRERHWAPVSDQSPRSLPILRPKESTLKGGNFLL